MRQLEPHSRIRIITNLGKPLLRGIVTSTNGPIKLSVRSTRPPAATRRVACRFQLNPESWATCQTVNIGTPNLDSSKSAHYRNSRFLFINNTEKKMRNHAYHPISELASDASPGRWSSVSRTVVHEGLSAAPRSTNPECIDIRCWDNFGICLKESAIPSCPRVPQRLRSLKHVLLAVKQVF